MIDSHVHIWNPAGGPYGVEYPWLTADLGELYREYTLDEFELEQSPGLGQPPGGLKGDQTITGLVLVQAADSIAETKTLLSAAAGSRLPAAVVGWLPLADPDRLRTLLKVFAGEPALVGVRHLIHDEPDSTWMLRTDVAAGMDQLAAAGMVFDAVAERPQLLAQVPTVARRHPDLTIVLDHLGKPPFGSPAYSRWRDLLAAAAAEPNVAAKISGLPTSSARTAQAWQDAVDHAIAVFGADRLMVGSDWPISTQGIGMVDLWTQILRTLGGISPADRELILVGNAQRIYRLS